MWCIPAYHSCLLFRQDEPWKLLEGFSTKTIANKLCLFNNSGPWLYYGFMHMASDGFAHVLRSELRTCLAHLQHIERAAQSYAPLALKPILLFARTSPSDYCNKKQEICSAVFNKASEGGNKARMHGFENGSALSISVLFKYLPMDGQ